MISRFVNLFKKSDLDELQAFQRKVHVILTEQYRDRVFEITEDPVTLKMGESTLGLTNLRANFLLSSQHDDDLRELMIAQFDAIFEGTEHFDRQDLDWDDAKQKLMPQMMPEDFLKTMELVHFPFGDGVLIGFVLDSEEAYTYIRNDEVSLWGVDKNEIMSAATDNLNRRSQGIEMVAVPGDNGMFVVNTMDGFDAVRILDKELQRLISDNIGSPFYVGVPNRDFLICWAKNNDLEFQNQMRSQISNDYDERPYPLSGKTFEVTSSGDISLLTDLEIDPRALTADHN